MKFYLTTPIYYINDKPHIGHAYTTIAADVLARWHRLRGDETFFLTGTDENSQKNVEAARTSGEEDLGAYLDRMSATWKGTWKNMDLTFNDFIRTTEERHKIGVEKFWRIVNQKDLIAKRKYEGQYCVGCESFKTSTDLIDGLCPDHKKAPIIVKEVNYFFQASRWKKALLNHIDQHPDFIQPLSRRNEVRAYIENYFTDVSVSRIRKVDKDSTVGVECGISVPGDPTQAIYVWFDALLNYLTAVGYGWNDELFHKWWPADLHIVGKDIIKFHCALWPAMLLSADLSLPKHVFAHGFFTVDKQKMSKTLGNVIDPLELGNTVGKDALRYFLLREIPFGGDGDFSRDRLHERYEGDLQHGLGNLVRRVLTLAEKAHADGVMLDASGTHDETIEIVTNTWKDYSMALEELRLHDSLEAIWNVLSYFDVMIEQRKPWTMKEASEERGQLLYELSEGVRHIAWMIAPFMPTTAQSILEALGIVDQLTIMTIDHASQWGLLDPTSKITKGTTLFPPLLTRN